MNHKEMTAHIRSRIKVAGIKASVSKYTSCGSQWIRVSGINPDSRFSPEEQETIQRIAKANGLTGPRGLEIEEHIPMGPEGHFVYHD